MNTDPDAEYRRAFTDDEVRALGYTDRACDGTWTGLDRLTPSEHTARDRQMRHAWQALYNPTRCRNPEAMRDALADAFYGKPTMGSRRRLGRRKAPEPFDWRAVRRQVDAENARARQTVPSPSRPIARDQRVRTGRRDAKPRSYWLAALDSECWRVADTPPGNRNNVLASSAFKIGQIVGDGLLDHAEAAANLLGAALDAGLPEREARGVIRSGLRKGALKPRGGA